MQHSKSLLSILFFYIFLSQSWAQSSGATINGRITDQHGNPLPYAYVLIDSLKLGTTTNTDGYYTLNGVPKGVHRLLAQFVGYRPKSKMITIRNYSPLIINIVLQENTQKLSEIVINADDSKTQSQELKESGYSVNAIETKELRNTTTDINQVLDKSTGIRVRQSGGVGSDFNFSINGLSGNAVKYFIDGVPLESMGSTMTLNNVPINLAKRIEVYKGVVPVSFGADAMGGVVNIVTNQSIRNYLDVSHSIGSFNTHIAAITGQYTHKPTGLILNTSAFLNYSKNNYLMHGVEIYDPSVNKYVEKDFKRFHDKYLAARIQAELGIRNKKWADLFFVGGSYSVQHNDIQTGATQDILYGAAKRKGYDYNTFFRYKKANLIVKNLDFSLFGAILHEKYQVIDTTYKKYFWDGSSLDAGYTEISGGDKNLYHYTRPQKVLTGNANYSINDAHQFNLNYTFRSFKNIAFNEYDDNPPTEDLINKHITGLAYQQTFLKERLTNNFFIKRYDLAVSAELKHNYLTSAPGIPEDATTTRTNYGYGIASRLKVVKNFGIKASYEKTYRLQSPEELLGNGVTLIPNFNLKPENSDNFNIGSFYGAEFGKNEQHKLFLEAGWFHRDARDFIYAVVYDDIGLSQYKNVSNVQIKGFEGEIRYTYNKTVGLHLNASYQKAINTTRGNGSVPEITYLNQIPNRPWFFGNAGFSIGKEDLIGKDTRIQFIWDLQYIHWFYLTWESFGSKKSKATVPTQVIQNACVSYALKDGRYNISLECRNLGNTLAYDNYKLQKPGRAFYLKFRYFLSK